MDKHVRKKTFVFYVENVNNVPDPGQLKPTQQKVMVSDPICCPECDRKHPSGWILLQSRPLDRSATPEFSNQLFLFPVLDWPNYLAYLTGLASSFRVRDFCFHAQITDRCL